ncbi:MAG: uncharacterized protein QOK31_383 [Solirubrobacteraceae bacterium]|jgi:uncharacterized membrane protein YfcA|nr:uncharacterized protein [Solirubrobacteraceae bacterium]
MIGAAIVGGLAGIVSGLLGVGGGILFVPALTILVGLSQIRAEATSLLAVVPVALLGAWRQHRYGNVRVRDAAVIGVLSAAGALGGVAAANAVPERALQLAFAGLTLAIAAQLARRSLRSRRERLGEEVENASV